MINWLRKYWVKVLIGAILGVAVIVVIPIGVNVIIGSNFNPTSIELHGTTSDWHSFWAVYLGALIGATVPFFILYTTIQNNKEENEKNRYIQINTIKYQTKIAWINQLKGAIIQVLDAIDETIARDFLSAFREDSNTQDFSAIYFKSEEKLKNASFSIETSLLGCHEKIEIDFLNIFREFKMRFQLYIHDVIFLLQFPNKFNNPEGVSNAEYFKKELLKYKKGSVTNINGTNPERIWEIAEKYEYKLISKRNEILQELFRWADTHFFKLKCKELLNAEYKIAESILTSGTKQKK